MSDHNHITRGDVEGCPACDKREGRLMHWATPTPTPERIVYPALTEAEFNATAWEQKGVRLVGDEDGEYVWAYGHVEPQRMTQACDDLYREVYGVRDWEPFDPDHHVTHIYAVRVCPEVDEWRIHWGAEYQDHPERFPLTLLDVDGLP